ncbi:MAG: anthranilate synthase component [Pseudomonadota bacterium]|jgi:anthranilate synthase component 1
MMQALLFDEFQKYAKEAQRVAVFKEIPADRITPITIYRSLKKIYAADGAMFEDLHQQKGDRYSFICFEPIASLTRNDAGDSHPWVELRDLQSRLRFATRSEVADLITSAIGFITYDAVRYFEEIPAHQVVDTALPLIEFNFYALNLSFNHEKQTLLISYLVEVGSDPEQAYNQAQQKIGTIIELLSTAVYEIKLPATRQITDSVEVDISDADFMLQVEKAKDFIIQGDAFQIVISRCYTCNYFVSPLDIYTTLRRISPAPFMFYFTSGANVIMGASPERLVSVNNKKITVNSIAGTRKRMKERSDRSIEEDLLNDPKERAEHMMLVDLARNDVGAVSVPGRVHLKEFFQVKHYSHVSHITSTVTGELQEKYDALDAFAAVFPAGTLSGAPKIRAMQIINELENTSRGLYGGAICRIDALGNLDSCIAIRMAILQEGIATIRTGAGIVYDSNPAAEAQETYQKASAMLDAITRAHAGE